MHRLSILACLVIAFPIHAQESAVDKADKRLQELLAPGVKSSRAYGTEPLQWSVSRTVADISLPIQPYDGRPARLPAVPLKAVKPGSAPEGTPLLSYREQSVVPKEVELPTNPLVQLPSVDVNQPLPIPILAVPVKDRAPLTEPAFEASLEATQQPFTPSRDQPVPFIPLNLPDPFEHSRAGQLRNPPDESPVPPVIPFQKPTK